MTRHIAAAGMNSAAWCSRVQGLASLPSAHLRDDHALRAIRARGLLARQAVLRACALRADRMQARHRRVLTIAPAQGAPR
ncbi:MULTISPECIES: hypothetical protein [Xanthomonas]|uniref:Uncharacterized protein n=1 Tax=Xanthomonas campestris pv. juglandis TaxID=195709 RepID=A0A7U7HLM8_XANCJ|nr:hypothetical protein [Xanthomonas arboricola]CAD1790443.1 hypothetical protein XSP_001588 [Xanthomonas arboricola pv. juglandis]CAD7350571.1 hypothetical protein X12_002793 [Xanthomonas arboricola]